MNVRTCLNITALAVAVSSCTTTQGMPSVAELMRETTGQNGRACVRKNGIQGYGVLENKVVSIDARRGYYLATVLPGCNDLQTSIGVAFTGNFGDVCGQTSNKILTSENHCTFNQMFEFGSREEAFSIYQSVLERRKELKRTAD